MNDQKKAIDWDTWKLRCHAIGYVIGPPKLKKDKEAGNLSATAKSYLLREWIRLTKGREKDITNKYVTKGLSVEEDSLTLYSRVKRKFFKKNTERLSNAWIAGEPDLFEGEVIIHAESITDIKSSWDIFTFYDSVYDMVTGGINPDYYWQLQGYMDLTGANVSKLSYELTDTPDVLIDKEKGKLLWDMGGMLAISGNKELGELYESACIEIDKRMKYDDIPIDERVIEFHIDRNQDHIDQIHAKVLKCREHLKYLDETLPRAIRESYSSKKFIPKIATAGVAPETES